MQGTHTLSIVIPALNEEKRIEKTIRETEHIFSKKHVDFELLVVDDGSTDNTNNLVLALQKSVPRLRLISLPKNRGKGFAVKTGVQEARGAFILILDADNTISEKGFDALLSQKNAGDLIIASRYASKSTITIKQPLPRRILGWGGRLITRLILLPDISDARCGGKLIRSDIGQVLFSELKEERYGFDTELLYKARKKNLSMIEVPIEWNHTSGSKIRPKDFFISLWEIVRIWLRESVFNPRAFFYREKPTGEAAKQH